jgi:hypothetical protein
LYVFDLLVVCLRHAQRVLLHVLAGISAPAGCDCALA